MGRLSPLSSIGHILLKETDNCPSCIISVDWAVNQGLHCWPFNQNLCISNQVIKFMIPDEVCYFFFNQKVLMIFFLIVLQNLCWECSLQVPQSGFSIELPTPHLFSWRNE